MNGRGNIYFFFWRSSLRFVSLLRSARSLCIWNFFLAFISSLTARAANRAIMFIAKVHAVNISQRETESRTDRDRERRTAGQSFVFVAVGLDSKANMPNGEWREELGGIQPTELTDSV